MTTDIPPVEEGRPEQDIVEDCFGSNLSFPKNIYGRERELQRLHELYESFCKSAKDSLRWTSGNEPILETATVDKMEMNVSQEDERRSSAPTTTTPIRQDNGDNQDEENDAIPLEIQHLVASMMDRDSDIENSKKETEAESKVPLILISGYSGCGKTTLVNIFMEQVEKKAKKPNASIEPCFFLSGKCDQYSDGSAYAALVQAINGFCDRLIEGDGIVLEHIRNEIITIIGDEGQVLTNVVPGLQRLIGLQTTSIETQYYDKRFEWNRLRYIFHKFFQVICSTGNLVVLFLDDLQWVDDTLLNLVVDVVTNESLKQLLFIGSYRSNEVGDEHALSSAFSNSDCTKPIEQIYLDGLSLEATEEFVADSLSVEVNECTYLATVVYKKTQGNIFFIRQTLENLLRENAIYKSMATFRWTWDEIKVGKIAELSDNVLDLVTAKISSLPELLQSTLTIAAYLRSTFSVDILLKVMENENHSILSQDLIRLLDKGVQEGLLVEKGMLSTYVFSHDRIKQAFYSRVKFGEERDALKVRVGKCLIEAANSDQGEDWMLFVAADHLNSTEANGMESVDIVRLNLRVGELAIKASAFVPGLAYLRKALESLELLDNPWVVHYELTLQLYLSAADVAFCLGQFESAKALFDDIMAYSNSLATKLEIQLSLSRALHRLEKSDEALTVNMGALRSIKAFPGGFYLVHALRDFRIVKQYFKRHSDYEILLLPPVGDTVKEATMEHLMGLMFRAFNCSLKTIFILALLRCIRYSIKFGVCAATAGAFAVYGQILIATFGDQEEGQRMARLAKSMLLKIYDLDRVKAKNRECSVLCNTAVFV